MKTIYYKGMTFGYYARNGYFANPAARREVDRIAEIGTGWICLVCTVMQETVHSTIQFRDFEYTPDDRELAGIIGYIHSKGIRVMLRPMIECRDGLQRSHIDFPDDGQIIPGKPFHYWRDWFDSYRALTRHYCRLADQTGCEAYCFDSELDRTVRRNTEWLGIVEEGRKHFRGTLTASLIHVPQFTAALKANPNHWFFALDTLGSSLYPPAADGPGATVEMMMARLRPVAAEHAEFCKLYPKPVYFGEIGCCSTAGAAAKPWFWENGGPYDGMEQANYLRAVLNVFEAEEWFHGLFYWKWDEQNNRPTMKDDPAGDKGFTLYGKPAADVFRNWIPEERTVLA